MSGTEQTMVQVITLLSCLVLIMGFVFYLKHNFQKKASNKVLLEVITTEGNSIVKLAPVEHGFVELPPSDGLLSKITGKTKKKQGKGKMWPVAEVATYQQDYPLNFPSFLQTKARKVVVREDTWEPISNLEGDPLLSPDILYNLKNEVFTELAVAYSRDLKEMQERLQQMANPKIMYVCLIGIAIVVVGIGYYLYNTMPELIEGIKTLRAAAGV